MLQVLRTFIVDLILIEDLTFSFPQNYGVVHGHILLATSRTSE
jgi:hypothetical protein